MLRFKALLHLLHLLEVKESWVVLSHGLRAAGDPRGHPAHLWLQADLTRSSLSRCFCERSNTWCLLQETSPTSWQPVLVPALPCPAESFALPQISLACSMFLACPALQEQPLACVPCPRWAGEVSSAFPGTEYVKECNYLRERRLRHIFLPCATP